MIKILAIGNSFSRDATCFLHQIAKAAGVDTKVVNLYIGGCPLERHWINITKRHDYYQYHVNGQVTDRYISIDQALAEEDWDFVVTQQASHDSGWLDTYEPFLGNLIDYIKEKVPGAKFVLHQTWAYELDSDHDNFGRYNCNQTEMYEKLSYCYKTMADKYSLPMIPCGDVIQKLRQTEPFHVQTGGLSLCRDGFHMSFVYGRYALACTWARKLLQISLPDNDFVPETGYETVPAEDRLLAVIRQVVEESVI